MSHLLNEVMDKSIPKEGDMPSKLEPVIRGENMPPVLFDLLSTSTPHGHEKDMLKIIINAVKAKIDIHNKDVLTIDKVNNLIIEVGNIEEHRTIFSCHTDTVHTAVKKISLYISDDSFVYGMLKNNAKELQPYDLGADDKLGIFILISMINKKIPGTYIFHAGEEHGLVGAKHFVKNNVSFIKKHDRVIAFDRRGYGDIITRQYNIRCCSDAFAESIAKQLMPKINSISKRLEGFVPYTFSSNKKGLYTDSCQYIHLVKECTNISVGYFNPHNWTACYDAFWYELILLPALLEVSWHKTLIVRDFEKVKTIVQHSPSDDIPFDDSIPAHLTKEALATGESLSPSNSNDILPDKIPNTSNIIILPWHKLQMNTPIERIKPRSLVEGLLFKVDGIPYRMGIQVKVICASFRKHMGGRRPSLSHLRDIYYLWKTIHEQKLKIKTFRTSAEYFEKTNAYLSVEIEELKAGVIPHYLTEKLETLEDIEGENNRLQNENLKLDDELSMLRHNAIPMYEDLIEKLEASVSNMYKGEKERIKSLINWKN